MFIKRKELKAMKEEIEFLEFKNLCQEFMVETLKFINNNLKSGISNFPTKYLVEELENREAVEKHIAEPYQDLTVKANGPAIVLVITD